MEEGPFSWLLYRPHTLTWLAIVLGFVLYCAFLLPSPETASTPAASSPPGQPVEEQEGVLQGLSPEGHHEKLGIFVAAVVFLCYCGIQLRDSVLLRPHPSFWRVVHGVGILYLLGLVFLLMQSPDSARRRVLPFLVPTLGNKPDNLETAYANDCRLYASESDDPWKNVRDTFYDVFTIAHALGWVGKAILLRDWRLLVILSVMWEILEYTLQDKLLNFHECWWDHWILDHTVCNMGGAAVGMMIVRVLDIDAYHWAWGKPSSAAEQSKAVDAHHKNPDDDDDFDDEDEEEGRNAKPRHGDQVVAAQDNGNIRPRASSAAGMLVDQFMPLRWVRYEWRMFDSWRRFLAILGVLLTIEIVEINAFTLKHVLWVPPECIINPFRLLMWFFLAQPAVHEWYLYIVDEKATRVG